jgi:hypothetical protein
VASSPILAEGDPWLDAAIDWERTIAFRRPRALGLGVAGPWTRRSAAWDLAEITELIREP